LEALKTHICLALLSVASAALLLFSSQLGLGTTPDSIAYIAGARGLLLGQGFGFPNAASTASPITNFPPLFSGILAAIGLIGIEPLDGTRFLNALLFALNGYLAGLLVYRATRKIFAGVVGAAIILTSPALLIIHSMVWSEPLFLFLILATALLTARYLEAPTWPRLLLAMAPVLLAPLDRYAGVALILAAALVIGRRNLRHAVAVVCLGSLGLGGWFVRNYFIAADLTNRQLVFHPPTLAQLTIGLNSVVDWLGGTLFAVAILLLLAFTRLRWIRDSGVELLLAFAGSYLAVLALTLSFVDSSTPLDHRILSPLYVSIFLALVAMIALRLQERALRFAWAVALIILLAINLHAASEWFALLSVRGVGFSSVQWRRSPTIAYLKNSSGITLLHTNAPDPVYLLTGMPATMFPRHSNPGTRLINPDYAKQLAEMHGIAVYFRAVTWRWYLPNEERLRAELRLRLVADLGDGAVYQIAP